MPSTTTNYSGRIVDISLFNQGDSDNLSNLGIRPQSLVITGKLKASQNYLRILLSNIGERKEEPLLGSDVVSIFKSCNFSFMSQVTQNFSIANENTIKYIKSKYTSDTPTDERIDKVIINNLEFNAGGKILLYLTLYTVDAEAHSFYLPVTWFNNYQ
jgi:hypothetical protein